MAKRRRSGVRTAKQRAQLKRAQAISARKRRGTGKKTKLAIGVVAVGSAGLGAYATRNAVRESALRKRHGSNYIPRKVTGYHHTYRQNQRHILKGQKFKTKSRFHDKQKSNEVWFTTGHKERGNMDIYGDYVVKVKVKRKHIAQHHRGWAKTGAGNKNRHNAWFSVKQQHLRGKPIRAHHAPSKNPVFGTKATRTRARRVKKARRRKK